MRKAPVFWIPTFAIDRTASNIDLSAFSLDTNPFTSQHASSLFSIKLKREFLPIYCSEDWNAMASGLTNSDIEKKLLNNGEADNKTKTYIQYYQNYAR